MPSLRPHWCRLLPGGVRPRGLRAEATHLVFKAHLVLGSLSGRTQHLHSRVTLTLRPQAQAAGDEALQPGPCLRTRELRKRWPRCPDLCEEKDSGGDRSRPQCGPAGRGEGRLWKAPQLRTGPGRQRYVPGERNVGADPSVPSWPSSDPGFLGRFKDVNQRTRRCHQQPAEQTRGGFGAEIKATTHTGHRLTVSRAAVPGPGHRVLLGDNFSDPPRQGPGCPQGRSQSREEPHPPAGVRGSGPAEASGWGARSSRHTTLQRRTVGI